MLTLNDGCFGVTDMSVDECRATLDGVFTKGMHAVVQQFVDRTRSDVLSGVALAQPIQVSRVCSAPTVVCFTRFCGVSRIV